MSSRADMKHWLERNRLSSLLQTLHKNKIDCLQDLKDTLFDEKDIDNLLKELNIQYRTQRQKLRKALKDLIGARCNSATHIDLDTVLVPNYSNSDDRTSVHRPDHDIMFNDLSQSEQIAMITPLLCGRSINSKGDIIYKSVPIFRLKPSNAKYNNHFHQMNGSKINVYSMSTASLVTFATNGYYNVRADLEASHNWLFVNASAKASYEESWQHSSQKRHRNDTKSLFAECIFRKGQIVLSTACLELTTQFQKDLNQYKQGQMRKETFHNMYGHWVDLRVTIGAKIYTSQTYRSSNSSQDDSQKEELKASFTANVEWNGGNLKGGISGGKSNNQSNNKAHKSRQTAMKCEVIGGNNLLMDQNDWTLWKSSINKHNWSVIQVEEIRDIFHLREFKAESRGYNFMCNMVKGSYNKPKPVDMNQISLNYMADDTRCHLYSEEMWTNVNKKQDHDRIEIKMEDYVMKSDDPVMQCSEQMRDFYNLSYKEKRELITGSAKLLHGRTFDANGNVIPSSYPVFELRADPTKQYASHFQQINQMQQFCKAEYDEVSKILVRSGYSCADRNIEASMKLGVYANIGGKYGQKTGDNHGSYRNGQMKDCRFIAQYTYPKGRISLNEQCVKVTGEYVNDYEALQMQRMTQKRFYDKYGLWIDLVVVIGGKIYSEKSKSVRTLEEEHKEKNEFASAFSAKLETCFSANGEAGMAHNNGNDIGRKTKHKHKMSSMNLLVIGGNAMSINEKNYTKWKESLHANPAKWEVIEIGKTESVLNLNYFIERDYPQKYQKLFMSQKQCVAKLKRNEMQKTNALLLKCDRIYSQFVVTNKIWCICGKEMKLREANDCYDNGYQPCVICDVCNQLFTGNQKVFHCSDKTSKALEKHPNGCDICKFCAC